MRTDTIQGPFTDYQQGDRNNEWTENEVEMLLKGVAAGLTWTDISAEISAELDDRSPKACELEFYRLKSLMAAL